MEAGGMRSTAGRLSGLLIGISGALAIAQTAPPAELNTLYEKLTKPGALVSVADGQDAVRQIEGWKLNVTKLPADDLYKYVRLRAHAALAVGDVNRADELQPELVRLRPELPETAWTSWLVACAAGDAKAGQAALTAMQERKAASAAAVARRMAALAKVGGAAPDVELEADGQRVALRRHDGKVLVLHIWSAMKPAEARQLKALTGLYAASAAQPTVQFVGVCTDAADVAKNAKAWAASNGLTWPQVYDVALKEADFGGEAGTGPVVLIDQYGYVRAVGLPDDSEWVYALRAAATEAAGTYRAMLPRNSAGVPAKAPEKPVAAKPEASGGGQANAAPAEQAKPKGELPHNDEARSMLDQARAYVKTGRKTDARKLFQEIIDKYPGTWEAADAKERLAVL
jgi:hypothetical protein